MVAKILLTQIKPSAVTKIIGNGILCFWGSTTIDKMLFYECVTLRQEE
jgi:hypothetical protein